MAISLSYQRKSTIRLRKRVPIICALIGIPLIFILTVNERYDVTDRLWYALAQRHAFAQISSLSRLDTEVNVGKRHKLDSFTRQYLQLATTADVSYITSASSLVLSKNGHRYLLLISSPASQYAVGYSSWYLIPENTKIPAPHPVELFGSNGIWSGDTGKIISYSNGEIAVESYVIGQPHVDPNNSSRFEMAYVLDGQNGIVEGTLDTAGVLNLVVKSGPLK